MLDKDCDRQLHAAPDRGRDRQGLGHWTARRFQLSGNITPANYFGDNKFYAVNTMQAPYQPSGNAPAAAASAAYADTTKRDHAAAADRRPTSATC